MEDVQELKRRFDIQRYLSSHGFPYKTDGENIGHGWIGIDCPFCSDRKSHCGVNLDSKGFYCWKCGEKGDLVKLLKAIEGINDFRMILNLMKDYALGYFTPEKITVSSQDFEEEETEERPTKVNWPLGTKKLSPSNLPVSVKRFLKERRFPLGVIEKYKVRFCILGGDYPGSIIIPVFENKKMVSYIARDITRQATVKYKICPNDLAVVPKRELVYGIDDLSKKSEQVIVVEGVTDKWRLDQINTNAVALLGKNWSQEQVTKISGKLQRNTLIKVFLDIDAEREARKLVKAFQMLFPHVRTIQLEKKDKAKDPGELSLKQAWLAIKK